MLEQADRDDPVEFLLQVAIVRHAELDRAREALFNRAFAGALPLLPRQRDAGDAGAAEFGEIECQSAPVAADVERALVLLRHKLGCEMALLGELRIVERLVQTFEIGAGVLPVGIEEQRIEPAVEIVMMRDVALRPRRHIELLQPPVEKEQPPLQPRPARRHAVGGLAEHDREQVGDRALLHPQRAVHVGFPEPDLGIEQHAALGGSGHEADGDLRVRAVADSENGATRRGEPQGPPVHESPEQKFQQPVHRPHLSCLAGPRAEPVPQTRGNIAVADRNIRPNSKVLGNAGQSRAPRLTFAQL